jgi:hypothetical protein
LLQPCVNGVATCARSHRFSVRRTAGGRSTWTGSSNARSRNSQCGWCRFLIICYFVAYLDRVNVSFAALTMNRDLGLSATAYGLGAAIFFFSYFIFEVPSNLALERFGARKWIARIMFSWGLVSGAMCFVQGELHRGFLQSATPALIDRIPLTDRLRTPTSRSGRRSRRTPACRRARGRQGQARRAAARGGRP